MRGGQERGLLRACDVQGGEAVKKILIPENSGDVRVIETALHGKKTRRTPSLNAIVVRPIQGGMDRRFEVDDLRDGKSEYDTFRTIDGALGLATGLMEPRMCHSILDVSGTYWTYAELACRPKPEEQTAFPTKRRREPVAEWDPDKDDHESLVRLFSDSIAENVHNVHEVSCSRIPTEPAQFLVEVVFRNDADERQEVDAALQEMNGLDWRVACDELLCRFAKRLGRDPDSYDWPTPDSRVEYAYDPDDGDVISVVRLSWHVDRRTYDMAYDYVVRERNG